jgi:hypothetical protein
MRRTTITLLTLLALASITIGVALAQSGHFLKKFTTASCNGESLHVCFKEAGLGNLPAGSSVSITLSGNFTLLQQCYTRSSNIPQAENKTNSEPFSATGSFPVDSNGNATGCLQQNPPQSDFSCPPGLVMREETTYTGVRLNDTTSGASTSIPGSFTCSQ